MANIVPFRIRIRDNASPPFLRDGTGERFLYAWGALVDARMEKLLQGVNAHLPTRAQQDAQAQIGNSMGIPRGLTEGRVSYGARLQTAIDDYHDGGTARAVLSQTLGYLLAMTPLVRFVSTCYDPSSYPANLESSTWYSYPVGRPRTVEPVPTYALVGDPGTFDWDSDSLVTGSRTWWNGWLVVFAVAPNDWCHQAQDWGTGSVYTPDASGYYSTVTGGAYALAGSYTGATQAWGAGSGYVPAADGYYSAIRGGEYVASGYYTGVSQAWGVDVTTDYGQSIAIIAKQFKCAGTWIRSIVVPFDDALFDPAQPADGTHNPAGTFGQWSLIDTGAYTDSRFTNAAYGGEVV
jgi:hypothetical protein